MDASLAILAILCHSTEMNDSFCRMESCLSDVCHMEVRNR